MSQRYSGMGSVICDLGVAARAIQGDKILLVKEARGYHQNRWGFPKGSVDSGESPETAVLRELNEETGASGSIIGLSAVRSTIYAEKPAVFLCYDVKIDEQISHFDDKEIKDVMWADLEQLKSLDWVSDTMHNLAIDALSGSRMSIQPSRPLSKYDKPYNVYSINKQSEYKFR